MKTNLGGKAIRWQRAANFIASCVLLALVAGCHVNLSAIGNLGNQPYSTTRTRVEEIPAALGMAKLEVENQFGEVKVVVAEEGSKPGWTWKLQAWGKSVERATELADAVKLTVETNGSTLHVVVKMPAGRNNVRVQSDLEFRVAKACAVRVGNGFGVVTIAGVDGPVEAHGEFGAMAIRGVRNEVKARNSFATLTVRDSGPSQLRNQNGSLEVSEAHGAVDAETSFAHLRASGIDGAVNVRNQNGAITVEGVKGEAQARTSFASLTVKDIGGQLKAANQNGPVTVSGIQGPADISTSFASLNVSAVTGNAVLANQNGGIRAREMQGDIQAETSFGTMDLEGTGTNFKCRNQNGAITLRANSPELARVDARTSFAHLTVHLPGKLKPAITAHTSFGKVESDFPVLMKPGGADQFAGAESGAARISLDNQNGSIRVHADK